MHQSLVTKAPMGPCFDLNIVPAVLWKCGAFDSLPKTAGVISHLPAGVLAGLLTGL